MDCFCFSRKLQNKAKSPIFAITKNGHHNLRSTESALISSACKNATGCVPKARETLYSGRQIAGQQLPKILSPRGDETLWRSEWNLNRKHRLITVNASFKKQAAVGAVEKIKGGTPVE